jgi:hypothetical protein
MSNEAAVAACRVVSGGSDMGCIRRSWLRGWRVEVGGNSVSAELSAARGLKPSILIDEPAAVARDWPTSKNLQPWKRNPPILARKLKIPRYRGP